jgi:hypothetical protein
MATKHLHASITVLMLGLLILSSCSPKPQAGDFETMEPEAGKDAIPPESSKTQVDMGIPGQKEQITPPYQSLVRTRAGDLTLSYAVGDVTLSGTLQRSTPCVNWKITSRVMGSFPEQVVFEVEDASTAEMCVQMLGEPKEVSESASVSKQATIRVLFEGEEVFSGVLGSDGSDGDGSGTSEGAAGGIAPVGATCCQNFNEQSGDYEYFWSDNEDCGVPEDTMCAGSCPMPADDNSLCASASS